MRDPLAPRRLALVLSLFAVGACKDLTLPDPPPPEKAGVIQGALNFVREGHITPQPAGGATVEVQRQSLLTTSDPALGTFRLEGLKSSDGSLLVRYVDPGTQIAYARSFSLEAIGAGFAKDLSLPTILLGHLSSVGGKVVLGDAPGPTGQGGTTVFIPEGPALTLTSDDGSFVLDNLPQGPFTLSAFRAGYVPQTVNGELAAAEQFALRTLTLERDIIAPAPATLTGRVLLGDSDDPSGVRVTASGVITDGGSTSSAADGTWSIASLDPGLYQVSFARAGYRTVTLLNVLARPGTVDLGNVMLLPPPPDAGTPVIPPDAGQDAGPGGPTDDAGVPYYAPTLAVTGLLHLHGGQSFNLQVFAVGASPEQVFPHPLTLTATSAPPDLLITKTGATSWYVQWDTGSATWGTFPFTLVLKDDRSTATTRVTLQVDKFNVPPVLVGPLPPRTLVVGVTLTQELSATDANHDPISISMAPSTYSGAQFTDHLDGGASFTFTPTPAELHLLPDGGQPGPVRFTFTASDGTLGSQQVLQVSVVGGSNVPPVWDPPPAGLTVFEANTLTFGVRATDPNGYPLQLSTTQLPSYALFTDNGDGSGAVTYTPGYDVVATGASKLVTFGFQATDTHALSAPLTLQVAVSNTARAPLITHHGDVTMGELSTAQVTTQATDPDGNPLSYTFSVAPLASGLLGVGLSQDGGSPTATITAPAGSRGSYRLTAGVSDTSFSTTDSYTLTVIPQPALTVAVAGPGTVTSSPAAFACTADGGTCAVTYAYGAPVTLTATPFSGAQFGGWSGACADAGTATTCALAMRADTSVGATFGTYFNLAVSVTGGGTVSADAPPLLGCGPASGVCAGNYQAGASVILTATPSAGNALSGWGGGCADAGASASCALTMSAARAASAAFNPVTAFAVVSGDRQTGFATQPLPTSLSVGLTATDGGPAVGAPVVLTGPPGSVSSPAIAITDGLGRATFTVRLARTLGTQAYTATTPTAANPLALSAVAVAPDAGLITTLVGVEHVAGLSGVPGPATVARINGPTGMALARDGTLYVAGYNNNQLFALSPAGVISVLAGTGACAHTGDLGPASAATFCNVADLALDETHGRRTLYLADNNSTIRAIDLAQSPPTITTFAGGGTAGAPFYGDGSPATVASLHAPMHLALNPGGDYLYIVDNGIAAYRRVDLLSGVITTWLTMAAGTTCTNNYATSQATDCGIGFDASGNAYVAFSPNNYNSYYVTPAVVYRVGPGATLTAVAGGGATSADGIPALTASLGMNLGKLAFDPAGNLYFLERSTHRIRKVEVGVGRIGTVVGTGAAGSAGELVDARTVGLNAPWTFLFDAQNNLIVSDDLNHSVRSVWGAGASSPGWAVLTAASGTPQTVAVDQLTPGLLAAKLVDPAGQPLSGYTIAWAVTDPGGALFSPTTTTNTGGVATALARPGLTPGASYRFTASFSTPLGSVPSSPVTFTVNTTQPDAGTIFTTVNVDHLSGADGFPGGATKAHLNAPTGLALSQDGTLFIADSNNHQVYSLTSTGQLAVVAGTGTCGHTGDGTPATGATLCNPVDLALDETHARRTLYVIDGTALVRAIDLLQSPPTITTFAGGGTAPPPAYGDGNAATYATLNSPQHLMISPAGDILYIVDSGIGRYRRVNLATGMIDTWVTLPPSTTCLNNYANSQPTDCSLGFDGTQTPYVAFTPGQFNNYYGNGPGAVYRVAPDAGLSLVAGGGATVGEGVQSVGAFLYNGISRLWFDPAGNLYLLERYQHRIRRVEAGVGRISTYAGTGTAGYAGDYVDLSQAQFNTPFSALLTPARDLIVSDTGNHAVRTVLGVAPTTFSWASLAAASGSPQTVMVDQVAPAPLTALLSDPAGQPLAGYTVYWNVLDPGGAAFLTSAVTNSLGVASTPVRPGLLSGVPYRFTASYSALAGPLPTSPATFTINTSAPDGGAMLSIVDVDHTAGGDGLPGPATRAHINAPSGLAVAANGTIYFAGNGNHQVFALSPAGLLTLVVGTGTCGSGGDGAAALAATLCNPLELALDETHSRKTLYILHGAVVRAVDLKASPPTITTFAGGATGLVAPFGDGNPATFAMLNSPQHIVLDPAGNYLYIVDNGISRFRRVNIATGVIEGWLGVPANTSCVNNYAYNQPTDCALAFDGSGTAYVSYSAGTYNNYYASGPAAVYRVNADLSATLVAGGGASAGEGVAAVGAALAATTFQLRFDGTGALYTLERGLHRVRKITTVAGGGTISTVAGTGAAGNGPDGPLPLTIALSSPYALAFTPDGKMLITDTANHTVRAIWQPYP
jgi:hypothetical protein